MAGKEAWSFEDDAFDGLSEAAARAIPPKAEHSIAWLTWHITRIEDMTMNVLAMGEPQVFVSQGWQERLRAIASDTGNVMSESEVARLSAAIDVAALRAYRLAVGRRTRQVIARLSPEDLKRKVDPARLQRLVDEGAVLPSAGDLLDYWGGLTIAGLLLMPATRHPFVHWNEALRIKEML